jgi:hypothetical protein
MAVNPSVVINLAAEFTGKKAFGQSEKAIDKLGKKLKQAVIGAGVTALLKSSVNAFMEEEKAASILANTLQNLGFAKLTGDIEKFIGQTQLASGVLDSKLRPAFQGLLSATRNVAESQKLLKLALNVSAGSSVDLETVTSDLANAYAGNMKGLKKYKLGLTQAELKVISFTDLQTKLNSVFSGASARAANTYAGKLARIKVAVDEAKEAIGKGIIDGLMVATGSENIAQLQRQIIDFGQSAGDAFRNLGIILKENLGLIKTIGVSLAAIWTLSKISAAITATIALVTKLNAAYKILRATAIGTAIAEMAVLNPLGAVAYGAVLVGVIAGTIKAVDLLGDAYEKAQNKKDGLLNKPARAGRLFTGGSGKTMATGGRDLAAEAAAKANAAATAKLTKATKEQLKLAKAKAIFDMQKIQIEAALKGKLTEEERLRLLLMKAIADENITMIEKYTKALADAQIKTKELQVLLDKINATKLGNPAGEIFYKGMTAAQIALEMFQESGGFRLRWDATDYYAGLTQAEINLEKFKEKGGFRLKWDATDYYAGLTNSEIALEKFKESGGFRLKWDATDFYAGLSEAEIALEKFKESGGFRRPDVPVIPPSANGGGVSGSSVINVTVNGALDPQAVADQIQQIFNDRANGRGNVYGLGLGSKDTQYVV